MSEYIVKDTELTAVANAIRAKTGGTDAITFPDGFASAIAEITTGIDAEVMEDVAVTLDFSEGNQTVTAEEGKLIKSAVIQKPETLIPENIAAGVDIAGVTGSLVAGGGEPVLNMEETEVTFAEELFFGSTFMMNTNEVDINYVIEGATYDVVWDGTSYPCTAWKFETVIDEEPVVFIGIGNTAVTGVVSAEPFIIGTVNGEMRVISLFDAENHTVSVTLNLSADGNGDETGEQYALITATVKRGGAALAGATVTATKGTYAVTGTTDANGQCVLRVTETGTYTIKSTYDGFTSSSGSVTVSGFSYAVSNTFFSATITIATETGATVTVEKDGRTYTATGEDMQAVITVYETGTYNVTSFYNGNSLTKTVDVTASTNYKVSIFSSHLVLEDTTWEAISALSAEGNPQNYFSVGDTKSVKLSGTAGDTTFNTTLYAYIIGFNHNESIEGKGIHFGTFKTADGKDIALVESTSGYKYGVSQGDYNFSYGDVSNQGYEYLYYNLGHNMPTLTWENSYTKASFTSSDMADITHTTGLLTLLPAELKAVLKKSTKHAAIDIQKSLVAVGIFTAYLHLLSEYEVFGTDTKCSDNTQLTNPAEHYAQYDYYKNGNSKIKYMHRAQTTACIWWLRGFYYSGGYQYAPYVSASGAVGGDRSRLSYGFAPIFVV